MTDRIEIWPVAGRLAIALRETVIFRFWCILLDCARRQSGGLPINNVIITLDDLAICDVEHPRTMRRYLDRAMALGYVRGFIPLGDDTYQVWFTGQQKLEAVLYSRAKPAGIMNSDEWERRKLFITPADFSQIIKFSGAIFASWLAVAIDHERMITWQYLSECWGVTRQAIEAWIAADGSIYRIENWGVTRAPYIDGDTTHILHNEHTGEYHYQRGNTYGVVNASERFAAQGKVWAINGLAGQPSLSTGERGSASQRGSNAVTRHSARPIHNDPDNPAPTPDELRTNYHKPRAFSKQRNRKPSASLYLLLYTSVGLRRSGRARRVWHHSAPLFTA